MKKWFAIGLLVIAMVFASAFVVACGDEEEAVDDALEALDDALADLDDAMADDAMTDDSADDAAADDSADDAAADDAAADDTGGVDINTIGLYFEDLGNNMIRVTDVPVPGMSFPIDTDPSNDFASTVEVFDADGNSLGMLETPKDADGVSTGELDYSAYADTAAKIVVTTFDGVEHEYELGM